VQQQSGVSTPLYNVQFVNRYTGWATGSNNVILKTTNGGMNWFQQMVNLSGPKNLFGLSIIDTNTGYVAGWAETILKTTNGGNNWIVLRDGPIGQGNSYNGASFINSQTGWLCGFVGNVLRTTNGGASWDSLSTGTSGPLRDIQFVNSQIGWVCGDGGYIRKTTNGGNNWLFQFQGTNSNLLSLYFINENIGWTVSEQQNEVFRTTNAGVKWDTLSILPGGNLEYSYCIYFTSTMTGWIGGTYGRVFKSTNGGYNWDRQSNPSTGFIWSFYFFNDSIGWATTGSRIIHTTNGGGNYIGISNNQKEYPVNFKLHQNYPNPFNIETVIEFDIIEKDFYKLEIYNMLGQRIDVMMNEQKSTGKYRINYYAYNLSSGVYLYSLSSSKNKQVKSFTLIK
ncbi:MAG: YCF48-related protein, partial [Ignavibacteria bacterium]